MKNLTSLILSLGLFLIGNPISAHASTFEKLMDQVRLGAVFKQSTAVPECPARIRPVESNLLPDWAQANDRRVLLTSESSEKPFSYKGNSIFFRPNLTVGRWHTLDRHFSFPRGIAFSVNKQLDYGGVLTSTVEAAVATMTIYPSEISKRSQFEVSYDSTTNTLIYQGALSGAPAITCIYVRADN